MKIFLFYFIFLISFQGFGQKDSTSFNPEDEYVIHEIHTMRTGFGPVLAYRGFGSHFLEAGVTLAGGGHGIIGFELT